MIEEIINWIDKSLKKVFDNTLFNEYFFNKEMTECGNTFYLINKSKGIELVMSNEFIITSIHLFSGEDGNYQAFKEDLPFKLKFSFTKDDIHELFGKPNKSGGGHKSLFLEFIANWDKYYFDNYSLHFQYSKTRIEIITIASLKLEEYFNSELQ